ncbi:MAG: hypothetical protein M1132_10600 [Chloroflexi bacterium]|nr:hypothetical protein [Chloroflexota bacterium]
MRHSHKAGCRCADCLSEFDRRQSAAAQLYSLLDMRWIGIRAAVAYAEFARQGIEEAFPPQAKNALGLLRQHNAGVLNNLLADILD